jgi:hypothetical protein
VWPFSLDTPFQKKELVRFAGAVSPPPKKRKKKSRFLLKFESRRTGNERDNV